MRANKNKHELGNLVLASFYIGLTFVEMKILVQFTGDLFNPAKNEFVIFPLIGLVLVNNYAHKLYLRFRHK